MADTSLPVTDQSGGSPDDASALSDIATNGNLLNQNLSALITAVGSLGDITLPVVNGGTGLDHVGVGDLLVGAAANTYTLLPDIATGNALLSGGVAAAPFYGKITPGHLSGVIPVTSGGTNLATLTAHAVLLGEGTASVAFASPGASGQILQSNGASSDPGFQPLVDGIGGIFAFPDNGTVLIWINSPFACTITTTTTKCTAGTCTATFKINTTTIGGTANSVSTTQTTQSHATSNVVNAGDDINITISLNSSCTNMSFMIAITRP